MVHYMRVIVVVVVQYVKTFALNENICVVRRCRRKRIYERFFTTDPFKLYNAGGSVSLTWCELTVSVTGWSYYVIIKYDDIEFAKWAVFYQGKIGCVEINEVIDFDASQSIIFVPRFWYSSTRAALTGVASNWCQN